MIRCAGAASKFVRFAAAGLVIVAGVIVGVDVDQGHGDLPDQRRLRERPGLFTGAAVDVLGVKVGTRDQRA